MEKIRVFKSRFSSAVIAIVMYLSFYFGGIPKTFEQITAVILGVIAGLGLSEVAARQLLSFMIIRRLITRPYFIEGYWRLETEEIEFDIEVPDNESRSLSNNGVMLVEYNHSSERYSVIVSRIGESGDIFVTSSEYCYMTEGNHSVKYLNYFMIRDLKSTSMCICDGVFVKRHKNAESVDFFSSSVFVENTPSRRQFAVPIRQEAIDSCRGEGEDWQIAYLQNWDRDFATQEVS